MDHRSFGNSTLSPSVLGFGAGHLGGDELTDTEATRLLHAAMDLGITLFDTARSYGRSEERLGRAFKGRRDQVLLSTKGGYGVEGVEEWTGPAITRGIDEALRKLATDHVDIFHLHSCDRDVLARHDVMGALESARSAGKIRVAAYSGENEALDAAISSGAFGGVQLSINICDRNALARFVPDAVKRGMGVIAKRPLANAPWRYSSRPDGEYVETYWRRFRAQELDTWSGNWADRALRFAAFAPGTTSVIVGTRSLEHLAAAALAVSRGPLPEGESIGLTDSWNEHGLDWRGEI